MKFPRTIQLDDSDNQIYERPALSGEWAVPASFAFLDMDPAEMTRKQRQAFGHGFLGTESFGWSTLVEIAEIDSVEYDAVVQRLATERLPWIWLASLHPFLISTGAAAFYGC